MNDLRPSRYATWMATVYLLVAGTYILVSGRVAAALAQNVAELEFIEHIKGIAFVLVTGVMLWLISWGLFSRLRREHSERIAERRALMLVQNKAYAAELAATVAHDFNNLLLVLRAGVEEMAEAQDNAPDPDTLREMRQALDSARDLTKRMARAARGERGSQKERLALSDIVSDTVRLVGRLPRVMGRDVELCVKSRAEALLDPVIIEQITVNLLLNAADATTQDGRIRLEVDADDSCVWLAVEDDGKGLSDAEFITGPEPFVSSKKEGLGLGLLSVRASAEASEGRVSVSRGSLGGARFVVQWARMPS